MATKPKIVIKIPKNIDNHLFDNVTLFSTRLNPIYDMEKMKALSGRADRWYHGHTSIGRSEEYTDLTCIYSDNKLAEQPFYKAKEIKLEEFINDTYTLEISYDLLKDISLNPTYTPVQNLHDLFFEGIKEYNNRAHLYDITTTFFPGYTDDMILSNANADSAVDFYSTILVNDKQYITHANNDLGATKISKVLSYPDHRASLLQLYSKTEQLLSSTIKPATAIDFAYSNRFADEYEPVEINDGASRPSIVIHYVYVKYPCFAITPKVADKPSISNIMVEADRLQVSAQSNLISLPYASSYRIGTDKNRILAINSAAIEMSDAKFGEFPLYVFTDEGIFAMQSGSGDVLYSATVPLNYDRIVNPQTLAVNHNVLYVTARGIHAMFSNESKLISEALNDRQNQPPLDYLCNARLCCQRPFNEIIVWNNAYTSPNRSPATRAYVYSLDGGYWSTRDLEGEVIDSEELISRTEDGSLLLLNIHAEQQRDNEPVRIHLRSRPIKLGSTEFKRLETLIARTHATVPQSVRICIEGSNDLRTWMPLRDTGFVQVDRDITLRRTPCSFRYLRLTLEASVTSDFRLTQFDIEYYLRFLHRLR